jgi:hypothetical protein
LILDVFPRRILHWLPFRVGLDPLATGEFARRASREMKALASPTGSFGAKLVPGPANEDKLLQ